MRVIFATSILCKFTFSRMYSYRTCNVPINIIIRLKNIAIIRYAFVINVRLIAIFFIYLISLFPFSYSYLKCQNLHWTKCNQKICVSTKKYVSQKLLRHQTFENRIIILLYERNRFSQGKSGPRHKIERYDAASQCDPSDALASRHT